MRRGVSLVAVLAAALVLVVGFASRSGASAPAVDRGVVDVNTDLAFQGGVAAGSGMVLRGSGVVLTNNHVIRGATTIRVVVPATGRRYPATVVGYTVAGDVAVLKLRGAAGLATIGLGDSAGVRRGDRVTAVGNAGGVGGKPLAAAGTITGLARTIEASDGNGSSERLTGLIETDARLQPGDSGGALVDSSGRVVGMNAAASSSFRFQQSSGRGFAIPINRVLAIASQILAGRSSTSVHIGPTPFLGVTVSASSFAGGGSGVVVGGVVTSSPADRAGVSAGDVIVSLDGHTITSPQSLTRHLLLRRPGMKVRLGWLDQVAGPRSAVVRLASGPPQ